ncbi:MAG: endo-1,4-beta-xylanase [Bacteroidales bacterium]|nr:endo-1,4-beta-xylanase [Bacteroidales bacterium]MBN2820400.1 endo-1,4-beta-xylanase [Bacteroidales bacterium]
MKTKVLAYAKRHFLFLILFLFSVCINAQYQEWYENAQERIDTLRKGDFGVKILDKNGQPYQGSVKLSLSKHEFPFGIAFDLYEGAVNNGNSYTTTSTVTAPEDAEIYQSERWYSYIAYAIPVEAGRNYIVTLKFAEVYFDNPNSRILNANIEGEPFLTNFDALNAAGGKNIAIDTSLALTSSDTTINIELVSILDNAAIKGIEIQTAEGDWKLKINCGGGELTTSDGNFYQSDEDYYDLNAPRIPSEEQWMKAAMQKYFNYGVSGNSFKWSGIQPQHTTPDYTNFEHAVDWTQSIGWDLRAHTLLWGGDDDHSMPGWIRSLPTPQQITDTCKMRVQREVSCYKGIVKEYDVINEPLTGHADWLRNTVGDSILWNCFKWAREVDPDAELYINDYNVELNWGQAAEYRDLVLRILENGGPVTGIGIQAHFWDCCRPNVNEVVNNFNILAETGLPLRLTEYDWGTNLTEEQQVDDFIMVATIAYSHPSVNGMICWGLSDNGAWRENTGFFDSNHRPKLAADTLLYLTKKLWATNFDTTLTNTDDLLFNAYYGDYTIEVEYDDTIRVFTVPCLEANADSVFVLSMNNAVIKGPELLEAKLLSDTSVSLVFDKPLQAESIFGGNFKFFSNNLLKIERVKRDTENENTLILTLQNSITPEDYLSVSYFPGFLKATDGSTANAFGPDPVENLTRGIIAAEVINDGLEIELTFNEDVENLSENGASFTVADNGTPVEVVAVGDDGVNFSKAVVTLSEALTSTSKPVVKYTKGNLKPVTGFDFQSTQLSVTNLWPKVVRAELSTNGNKLDVLFNTLLINLEENIDAFVILANDEPIEISSISETGKDSSIVSFNLNSSISSSSTVTISYTKGTVKGQNGNSLANIEAKAVVNNSNYTSIIQSLSDKIKIFPNPASNQITITSDEFINEVLVFDMTGKCMVHENLGSTVKSYNLSVELESGLYYVEVKGNSGSDLTKLIIRN